MTPTSQFGKCVAIFFIPLACFTMGQWVSLVANNIIGSRSSRFRRNILQSREFTPDDLYAMDVNGDGVVTRAEFLDFLLVAMDKIDEDLVLELRAYFEKLDIHGKGELSRDDLIEVAKRKLRSPRRKLELATYKQKLLKQAERPSKQRLFESEKGEVE
jgi:potassium channel subfamily K